MNDASWAPDATALLTGSIENVCVVWDVTEKHRAQGRLTEHGHYVQGVAWDPAQQYVVSQSADRTCRHVPACTADSIQLLSFLSAYMEDCEIQPVDVTCPSHAGFHLETGTHGNILGQ